MAATTNAFLLSPLTDRSLQPLHPPQLPSPFSHHFLIRPLLPAIAAKKRCSAVVSCLISGVDGGGVSDDFLSTRKPGFDGEFEVIASMLRRIQPLDTSIISKGVSDSAKDSMKQTISTMLGLLPSEQFSVTIGVAKDPLDRLVFSSIITGCTLWNVEYRISLTRNLEISPDSSNRSIFPENNGILEVKREEREDVGDEVGVGGSVEDLERNNLQSSQALSSEALKYIEQLESELSTVKQELDACKQDNMQMEYMRQSNNDLLEYLRSLESNMVTELSRPSSSEVEEIIHQLSQNILQRFFNEETVSNFMGDSGIEGTENYQNGGDEFCDTVGTSRDYLAKLLFWCMLLGHHLRGLENRLHLSCVVGLL
ncbi:unnamed protein product [Ilex paraguariensis]|uniref:Uncharacterized protein n=1 Tax=Ilex paraguariensis TaxID=185542 RepID=A0ABC8USP1_9AQUA